MNAEILAVGTELLMGQIANTNAQYLSMRLAELGIGTYYHSVVGDNPKRLEDSLNLALSRADVIITTGGLGPTMDDLTKETIAKAMGRELVFDQESLDRIENIFSKLNKKVAESNKKQAYLPENSVKIKNNYGTAPGCIIEEGKKIIIMLPGPPNEMRPMFEDTIVSYLMKKTGCMLVSRILSIFGIGESELEKEILDIIEKQSNPTIAPYVRTGEVTLRITAKGTSEDECIALIDPVINQIKERIGDSVYSIHGENLETVVYNKLKANNLKISIAESCTGGMLMDKIVNIPGSSEVFDRGYVTYSNKSKVEELGVSASTIEKFGAVSEETASEMVKGLVKRTGTDIGVSITGIAGPDGGTEEKPVGLVYIAYTDGKEVITKKINILGKRARVRHVACLHALNLIRTSIK